MITVNNVNVPLDTDFSSIRYLTADFLNTDVKNIKSAVLYRRSVDARHKNNIHFCCSFRVEAVNEQIEQIIIKKNKNAQPFSEHTYLWEKADIVPALRPVIAGFGPAGMFAALALARAGMKPLVIERGKSVRERTADVENFFNGAPLEPESNVQFGEGGAGTFSDGKLNTGIKNSRCRTVLEEFVRFGAPESILIDAKPHIGTDILVNIVENLRNEVIRLGGEVRFSSRLDGIKYNNGSLCAVTVNGEKISCDNLILAIGHSARDTLLMLSEENIKMMRKPFSMGVRIEHLQSDINRELYGSFAGNPALGAADYKLAVHLPDGRGVYTFCMCPGGEVINASSEKGKIAVNGMSRSGRDGKNANSAVLVTVNPEDLKGSSVLAGCEMQREIEARAYSAANGAVPVTTVGEFLYGKPDTSGKIRPTVKPDTVNADFDSIFPEFIAGSLRKGIALMEGKLRGFADPAAVLTAPETRSSCPVRIIRDETLQSVSVRGIYPCGEGAGYAGGIMSAAADGLKTAEMIIAGCKLPDKNIE